MGTAAAVREEQDGGEDGETYKPNLACDVGLRDRRFEMGNR